MGSVLNGCACFVFAAGLAAAGAGFIVSGKWLAPADDAAATVFRTDPSCAASVPVTMTRGACTNVPANVVFATMRRNSGGLTRTHTYTPHIEVRLADGTALDDDLAGAAGSVFVDSVPAASPVRVQLFRGTFVRVVSGPNTAETISAPDISASTDSELPWVGGVLLAIAALCVWGGVRSLR